MSRLARYAKIADCAVPVRRPGPSGGTRRLARILITSGPTRQYLDPVRYLTNASSGRMGKALAEAALDAGHEVAIVSGPVDVAYPAGGAGDQRHFDRGDARPPARPIFAECDGLIGVAAPCDYRPVMVAPGKIAKTGEPLVLQLVETADVVATLGATKHAAMAGRLRPRDRGPPPAGPGQARKETLRPDGPQRPRGDALAKTTPSKSSTATGT